MDTTNQLISGYTAYTDAEQLGAEVESDAPATATLTTSVLSTAVCASAVGATVATWYFGC